MITVEGDVQTEILSQTFIVAKSKHVGVVPCSKSHHSYVASGVRLTHKVQVLVDRGDCLIWVVYVSIDAYGQGGQLGDEVQTVFERIYPVLALLDPALVRSLELAVMIQSSDTHAKLGHRVKSARKTVCNGVMMR